MAVASRRIRLGMTQKGADHGQRKPGGGEDRGIGVPKVMDPAVLKLGLFADPGSSLRDLILLSILAMFSAAVFNSMRFVFNFRL